MNVYLKEVLEASEAFFHFYITAESAKVLWSLMDDSEKSIYKNEKEFIEVKLRESCFNLIQKG